MTRDDDRAPEGSVTVADDRRIARRAGSFDVGIWTNCTRVFNVLVGDMSGTSLSAPLIAAVYALAGNASSWAHPAQSVYGGTGLRDVTSGSNGTCPSHPLQCNGAAGSDLPTGNGTPLGLGTF